MTTTLKRMTLLGLLCLTCPAYADEVSLSLGADYLGGEYTVTGQSRNTVLNPRGPGVSLGLSFTQQWTLLLNYSRRDDRDRWSGLTNSGLEYEISTVALGLGYGGNAGWWRLHFQQDREETMLVATADGGSRSLLRAVEQQTTDTLTLEVGKDWEWGLWTPSLAVSLSRLSADIRRDQNVPMASRGLILAQAATERLEGFDLGFYGGLDYYFMVDDTTALIPTFGVGYQQGLGGDITGSTLTALQRRGGARTLSAQRSSTALEESSQAIAEAGLNLLAGDWQLSLSYARPWLVDISDAQWLAGVSVSF